MTTIKKGNDIVTLINIFTVAPENQQQLIDILVKATEQVMKYQSGYISANIHKSLDGTRVTNYAQWQSKADFEAIFSNPQVAAHMQAAAKLASFEPHLYEVVFTDEISR